MNNKEILRNFEFAKQRAQNENSMEAYIDFMSELASKCVSEKEGNINVNSLDNSSSVYKENVLNDNFLNSGNDNICNTYDYTNVIVSEEDIKTLIKYVFDVYDYFLDCSKIDDGKNEAIKYEFRYHSFKRRFLGSYGSIQKEGKTYQFNNYEAFLNFCSTNGLKNIGRIYICLTINFGIGLVHELVKYDNKLDISIKPYNINFTRKSNINYDYIDKFEQEIKKILDTFKRVDTIF